MPVFMKVKGEFGNYLIIYEYGHLAKPIAILTESDMVGLIKEWEKKV